VIQQLLECLWMASSCAPISDQASTMVNQRWWPLLKHYGEMRRCVEMHKSLLLPSNSPHAGL
jgi:hypothetical protein